MDTSLHPTGQVMLDSDFGDSAAVYPRADGLAMIARSFRAPYEGRR